MCKMFGITYGIFIYELLSIYIENNLGVNINLVC